MDAIRIYLLISMILMVIIAVMSFSSFFNKKEKCDRLSNLAVLAFLFVIIGTLFEENRIIGYGLMSIGTIIAVADIVKNKKKK